MIRSSRRKFLQTAGGVAALDALPGSIRRALAIGANQRTGTLQDVEHIVVFMQENRSFDHYLGHLRGVRGYNDRFPIPMHNGLPIWHQPSRGNPQVAVLPFHLDTRTTSAQCIGDMDHSWYKTHAAQNGGRNDQWPANKTDMTMGYHQRGDIPFHYALADAFTVCDHYFASMPSQTHPNRMYLMSGTIDPTGKFGGPLLDNQDFVDHDGPPDYQLLSWTTYPERLQAAGISWQVYQQGLDWKDPVNGNYGTNALMNFKQYIDAAAGSPLYERAMSVRTLDTLKQDVLADRLPQVSWILPPAVFSEHPRYSPAYGADYTSRVLDALTANPQVWSKTVLLLMYDENDGFFDHVMPPQPPMNRDRGLSTVPVEDELHRVVNAGRGGHYHADGLPYGLGPRVPMTVISPWTRGGFVCSQVFDHTSVIRFIETRFGVHEPNISAWRRTVCGDLTSAFDFSRPDSRLPGLPNTSDYRAIADFQCANQPKPRVPSAPLSIDPQEPGVRPARALPYSLQVHAQWQAARGGVAFRFENQGAQGAHFYVYSRLGDLGPWSYTVGAGQALDDVRAAAAGGYAFSVYGPNGFFRQFDGASGASCELQASHDLPQGRLALHIVNPGQSAAHLVLTDNAYGAPARRITVHPGATSTVYWPLPPAHYWYDISLTNTEDARFLRRLAGHAENGRPSSSDPAATAVTMTFSAPVPANSV